MRIWLRRKTQKGYGSRDKNSPGMQRELQVYYGRTSIHFFISIILLFLSSVFLKSIPSYPLKVHFVIFAGYRTAVSLEPEDSYHPLPVCKFASPASIRRSHALAGRGNERRGGFLALRVFGKTCFVRVCLSRTRNPTSSTTVDNLLTVLTVNIFLCYAEFCKKAPFVPMLECGKKRIGAWK